MVKLIEIENELEWQKFRNTGLGASEISALLGMNPYMSSLELFHRKLGFQHYDFINLLMLGGKETENFTSKIFEAYNGGTPAETARNIQDGIFYRKCEKFPMHSFVQNDSWDQCFVSPDRKYTDLKTGKQGYVEIKNVDRMVLAQYPIGYVPSHVIQLLTQMAVGEQEHGTLAYLINRGADYKEYHFERNGIIWHDKYTGKTTTEEDLKIIISEFWEAVVLGRQAMHNKKQAELNFNMIAAGQYQAIIDQCEPEPDNLVAYENFVKENFFAIARPKIEVQGTEEHLLMAEGYLKAAEEMKSAKEQYQLHRNIIFNSCKAGHRFVLPGKGFIDVSGTKRGVSLNVKL